MRRVNFTELGQEEALEILSWRNHSTIRKWMYTQEVISEKQHFAFIESLKDAHTKEYFVLEDEGKKISVIDFTNITAESCEFGLYVNPFESSKGRGTKSMQEICNYAFHVLKVELLQAEVFAHNEKAIHLYEKFHFKKVGEKSFKNQLIFLMELQQ